MILTNIPQARRDRKPHAWLAIEVRRDDPDADPVRVQDLGVVYAHSAKEALGRAAESFTDASGVMVIKGCRDNRGPLGGLTCLATFDRKATEASWRAATEADADNRPLRDCHRCGRQFRGRLYSGDPCPHCGHRPFEAPAEVIGVSHETARRRVLA